MESTGAPGLLFCLPHPELGDFFLTGSALLETVGFDLIRLGTRKQPSGRPRIASRFFAHAGSLERAGAELGGREKLTRPVAVAVESVRLEMGRR